MDTIAAGILCLTFYPAFFAFVIIKKEVALWVVTALTFAGGSLIAKAIYKYDYFWSGTHPEWHLATASGFAIMFLPCILMTMIVLLVMHGAETNAEKG